MKDSGYVDALQSVAQGLEQSNESASVLLASILDGSQSNDTQLKIQQKRAILDSFKINKFHRDVKNWQADMKEQFEEDEISRYNKKLAQMDKVNFELDDIVGQYETNKKLIKLPQMQLSVHTIREYEGGSLMAFVEPGQNQIEVSEFFSLEADSDKPLINYEVFTTLVNIELRLKVQRMIKFEILCKIKNDLDATSRKWTGRNAQIEKFFTQDLARMVSEVNKVRQDEIEQYEEEDEDMDGDVAEDVGEVAEDENGIETGIENEAGIENEVAEDANDASDANSNEEVKEDAKEDAVSQTPEQQEPTDEHNDDMNID